MKRYWSKVLDDWVYEVEVEQSDTTEEQIPVTYHQWNCDKLIDLCDQNGDCPICEEIRRQNEQQSSEEDS